MVRQGQMMLVASAISVLTLLQLLSLTAAASTGLASFYTEPYLPTACYGNDPTQIPHDKIFAAGGDGSHNIWNNGGNCGKHFQVQCQGNGCRGGRTIRVKIIDRCPNGCSGGRAFDLSAEAFAAIADPNVGVITVQYSSASNGDAEPSALIAQVGHIGQ